MDSNASVESVSIGDSSANFQAVVLRFLYGDDALFRFQEGHEAKAKLMEFMQEQVTERKADVNTGGAVHASDAFSMLVEASEHEEAKYRMDDSELVSTEQ